MQICRDIHILSYLHAVLTFRLWAAYADISSSEIEKQVQTNVYKQLAKRCEHGSSGAESAWHTQGHSLCTEVSDEELLVPTDAPQQTNTGSKPPAQPNLAASLLSSPEPNILSLPHQASIRASLLFFTGNFHRILKSDINYLFIFKQKYVGAHTLKNPGYSRLLFSFQGCPHLALPGSSKPFMQGFY